MYRSKNKTLLINENTWEKACQDLRSLSFTDLRQLRCIRIVWPLETFSDYQFNVLSANKLNIFNYLTKLVFIFVETDGTDLSNGQGKRIWDHMLCGSDRGITRLAAFWNNFALSLTAASINGIKNVEVFYQYARKGVIVWTDPFEEHIKFYEQTNKTIHRKGSLSRAAPCIKHRARSGSKEGVSYSWKDDSLKDIFILAEDLRDNQLEKRKRKTCSGHVGRRVLIRHKH